jgi:hypothetical protein
MTDRYFDKFPLITYANNTIVDITRRVTLLDRVSSNPYAFYPFEITNYERPDQLCNRYYNDSYKTWLIYLANNIKDPYYEWYLSEDELNEFVELKYGSVYKAQTKVNFYRNDWENKESISKSEYNALTPGQKKYWNPNYGMGSSVINYHRKEVDWSSTTNKIISYSVSNTNFITDELCNIRLQGDYIGKGQVVATTNTNIYLQHVYGSFFTSDVINLSSSSYIYGTESNCNAVVTAVSSSANNIAEEELVYWKPITYYDFEVEKNEYNKSIRVIDSNQASVAVDNLRVLLETE